MLLNKENMKKISLLTFYLFYILNFSQVAIGKTTITNSSVSLEFANANRGIVLPWVTSSASVVDAVPGTMIYDLTDHKIKIKYNTEWKDFSVDINGNTTDPLTNIDGAAIQNSAKENTSAKVSIGSPSSIPGIL